MIINDNINDSNTTTTTTTTTTDATTNNNNSNNNNNDDDNDRPLAFCRRRRGFLTKLAGAKPSPRLL